jgi:hypothetical protein
MIHWAEPGQRTLCGEDGEGTRDESAVTCGECLCHLIAGALEDEPAPQGSLYALRLCAILAKLANPNLVITLIVT